MHRAVSEPLDSTVELELRSRETFSTYAADQARSAALIEEDSHDGSHSARSMPSPVDYELALAGCDAA